MTWHYAFVHREADEEWDVYEVFLLDGRVARTQHPVMCLAGADKNELAIGLGQLLNDVARGNFFSSIEDMDTNFDIGDDQ